MHPPRLMAISSDIKVSVPLFWPLFFLLSGFFLRRCACTHACSQHYSSLKLNARLKPRHGGGANNSAAKICVSSTCVHPAFVCVCEMECIWLGWMKGSMASHRCRLSVWYSICLSVCSVFRCVFNANNPWKVCLIFPNSLSPTLERKMKNLLYLLNELNLLIYWI